MSEDIDESISEDIPPAVVARPRGPGKNAYMSLTSSNYPQLTYLPVLSSQLFPFSSSLQPFHPIYDDILVKSSY